VHSASIDPNLALLWVRPIIATIEQWRMARQTQMKRMDALQGDRRGSDEEAELGFPGHQDWLSNRNRDAQAHKQDRNRGSRRGRHRVHHDAQLAVIGIGLVAVYVRNLRNGQERHQDQAHGGDNRQKAGAALPEPLRPQCRQNLTSPVHFTELTENWTLWARRGCRQASFYPIGRQAAATASKL
jgi:hypothetical protein